GAPRARPRIRCGWTGRRSGRAPIGERGPYRFTIELLGTSPERVPGALVPGDSVTGEAIDAPGDWDEYTLRAVAGQDLNIVFQTPGSPGYPWLIALDPATGDTLA